MSCCGSARNRSTNFPSPGRMGAMVLFEYTGKTALSIVGPGSQTAYRFALYGRARTRGSERPGLFGPSASATAYRGSLSRGRGAVSHSPRTP
jgi:hypothetical protein